MTKTVSFRLDTEMLDKLQKKAIVEDRSLSKIIVRLLKEGLKEGLNNEKG